MLCEGVNEDYSEAVKWFLKAAEQGNINAQLALGSCYYYGLGIAKDYFEAEKWWRKAAEQGSDEAVKNLKKLGY